MGNFMGNSISCEILHNYFEGNPPCFARKKERTTLFGVVLLVDDTRLEFGGPSINPYKSASICTDLYVFENF